MVSWSHPFPSSLGEGFTPPPTPSPGLWTPGFAKGCYGLLQLFGYLDAIHFSIAFSMPSWVDLGSIFPPNLPPKIHQNPLKIDAKMPSHLDSIFGSIFHRFLPPTSIPCTVKIIVFPKEKRGFFKKSLFEVGIGFCSILVPTCFDFSSKN